MVAVFRPEALIAATKNRSRGAALPIQCRDAGLTTNLTARVLPIEPRQGLLYNPVMKYLIIGALLSIIFVLVYSRVRPYLKLIEQVIKSFQVVADVSTTTAASPKTPSKNKLVRCESCGTWIPAERALNLSSGLATFCSPECMAKKNASPKRKIAG